MKRIEQLYALQWTSRKGEVNLRGLLELLHALTFEVCKPRDFLLQSHTAVSLSIPLGFVHPFEALQTFFVHGAINSYLWTILEISVHLQHWKLEISYLPLCIGFFRTTCWAPTNFVLQIKMMTRAHPFVNLSLLRVASQVCGQPSSPAQHPYWGSSPWKASVKIFLQEGIKAESESRSVMKVVLTVDIFSCVVFCDSCFAIFPAANKNTFKKKNKSSPQEKKVVSLSYLYYLTIYPEFSQLNSLYGFRRQGRKSPFSSPERILVQPTWLVSKVFKLNMRYIIKLNMAFTSHFEEVFIPLVRCFP